MMIPQDNKKQHGVTLIELLIANAILAAIIFISMLFMSTTGKEMADMTDEAHIEAGIEHSADLMLDALRETTIGQTTMFRFTDPSGSTIELPDGTNVTPITQVATVFPTPRDDNGKYITTSGGNMAMIPTWQGVVVYAYYNSGLYEYIDRNAHTYSEVTPLAISTITSTTITLNDGTTFPRNGSGMSKPGTGSNRSFRQIMADLGQIEVEIAAFPKSTSGYYNPAGFSFPILIWALDPSREQSAAQQGKIAVRQLSEVFSQMRN